MKEDTIFEAKRKELEEKSTRQKELVMAAVEEALARSLETKSIFNLVAEVWLEREPIYKCTQQALAEINWKIRPEGYCGAYKVTPTEEHRKDLEEQWKKLLAEFQ